MNDEGDRKRWLKMIWTHFANAHHKTQEKCYHFLSHSLIFYVFILCVNIYPLFPFPVHVISVSSIFFHRIFFHWWYSCGFWTEWNLSLYVRSNQQNIFSHTIFELVINLDNFLNKTFFYIRNEKFVMSSNTNNFVMFQGK